MEISPKVLREVEFSGSLRGYNTDEVDEFLEQVAVGLDRLQSEARAAVERAENDRLARDRTGSEDEETIRRTLILAQRTADLAIKEAKDEATLLVDNARAEAESVISDARDSAERLAVQSEVELRDEVTRLSTLRDSLEAEIGTLVSLLDAERDRLTDSLSSALQYVEQSVRPSADIMSVPGIDLTPAAGDGSEGSAPHPVGSEGDGEAGDWGGPEAIDGDDHDWSPAEPVEDSSSDAPEEAPAPTATDDQEIDDLEANIAEDAAKAAPVPRQLSGQYDWDSVARARSGTVTAEGARFGRANLTAVPPLADPNDAGPSQAI